MSSTRKPKPPDRGAPDHKPSRKVALNEVLRSLQDLVQNELNVESGSIQTSSAASPAARSLPPSPESTATPALAPNAVPPDSALAEQAPPAVANETMPPDPRPALGAKPAAPAPEKKAGHRSPAGGIQQELPYLDTDTAPEPDKADTDSGAPHMATSEPEQASAIPELEGTALAPGNEPPTEPSPPETNTVIEPDLELDELPALPVSHDTASTDTQAAADSSHDPSAWQMDEGEDLNDIPVLEDAVDLSDTLPIEAASIPAHPPAPTEARRLAIQAAARLNVALRKEGKPVLASDVIARLVRELEQVLANGAPNVDNTRPKQH